jgi:thiol-disulfide isomerase/thioredoxin
MKRIILILTIILLSLPIYSNSGSLQEKLKETYVVYYFGATSCGYCNMPENIKKIKKIKIDFSKKYPDSNIKYVMVCMDRDIEEGLKFIKKYGYWDEISIGNFYNNELALIYLNQTEIPGVPHVMVYRDLLVKKEKGSIYIIKERKLLVDLVGGTQIGSWINDGYPLKNQ